MKPRFCIFFVVLFCFISVFAQDLSTNLQITATKKVGPFTENETFVVQTIKKEKKFDSSTDEIRPVYSIVSNDDKIFPLTSNKDIKKLEFHIQNIQDLWDANIIKYVLLELHKNNYQSGLRAEMELDALEYVSKIKNLGLELDDPYLKNYIYSLIAKLVPENIIDGRPCNVNLLIIQSPEMNAGMYPNGTLEITTGLISKLHTEDELVAILGHEVAHFLLDHSIQNVNKAIARQKRAEFWAGLATVLTAVGEIAIASNSNYIPGQATFAVAIASQAIANQVVERLGMEYNHEQEEMADQVTIEMLDLLGYDSNALSTALSRIKTDQIREYKDSESYTHPSLKKRIKRNGLPNMDLKDTNFEKIISFAVSNVANMTYQDRRFKQAIELVTQNIINGVATDNDYLLKANCLFSLYDSAETNAEAMDLINQAKSLNPENIYIYKAEILGKLRMGEKELANELLISYRRMAEQYALIREANWAKDMLCKLRGM